MKVIEQRDIPEDTHILKLWTPLKFEVKKDYTFIPRNPFFKIASMALYTIALPLVYSFNKIMYGCKVVGIENLKQIKGARMTVSNHVHPMDCTMNAMIQAPRQVYFPTLQDNFKIPVVNGIIRLLHAIPIPNGLQTKVAFYKSLQAILQKGSIIHMYPEAALWPYATNLRKFKSGAFQIAVEQQVPIIPIVYCFVKPYGIRKWKKKPCIQIHILKPVYPSKIKENNKKEVVQNMKQEVYQEMKLCLQNNTTFEEEEEN
ncbi:MAG: lysophospholipid acyltransferase family protein [Clostridia bacterium]